MTEIEKQEYDIINCTIDNITEITLCSAENSGYEDDDAHTYIVNGNILIKFIYESSNVASCQADYAITVSDNQIQLYRWEEQNGIAMLCNISDRTDILYEYR